MIRGRGKGRGAFAWGQLKIRMEAKSSVRKGREIGKITKGEWCHKWCIKNFKSFERDKAEAVTAWYAHLDSLPTSAVSTDKETIWDIEKDYVVQENEKSQQTGDVVVDLFAFFCFYVDINIGTT